MGDEACLLQSQKDDGPPQFTLREYLLESRPNDVPPFKKMNAEDYKQFVDDIPGACGVSDELSELCARGWEMGRTSTWPVRRR